MTVLSGPRQKETPDDPKLRSGVANSLAGVPGRVLVIECQVLVAVCLLCRMGPPGGTASESLRNPRAALPVSVTDGFQAGVGRCTA